MKKQNEMEHFKLIINTINMTPWPISQGNCYLSVNHRSYISVSGKIGRNRLSQISEQVGEDTNKLLSKTHKLYFSQVFWGLKNRNAV